MNRKTKAALAALFIAALATPAAAQGLVPYYNYSPSYAARSHGLIEGRQQLGMRRQHQPIADKLDRLFHFIQSNQQSLFPTLVRQSVF